MERREAVPSLEMPLSCEMERYVKGYYAKDAYKTYKANNVQVCTEWVTFTNFKRWLVSFDIPESHLGSYDLDKDILGDGTLYSPESCTLLPHKVNTFILDKASVKSPYPIGVYKNKDKYIARCNNPLLCKREHLGSYFCPEQAHQVWLDKKLEILEGLRKECELPDKVYLALKRRYLK